MVTSAPDAAVPADGVETDGGDAAQAPLGLFVVFEGGDGAGKSTQVRCLSRWLTQQGIPHLMTREPGDTPLGARLREVLLHSKEAPEAPRARAEALLFAADRAQHVESVVLPALARGDWVLCDRYVDSSIAYQGGGRELDPRQIAALSRWATGGLLADLTVLLDVPVALGAARRRGAADRMEAESVAFHEQVAHRFRELAARAPARYLVVDAAQPPEAIFEVVLRRLRQIVRHDPSGEEHSQRVGP